MREHINLPFKRLFLALFLGLILVLIGSPVAGQQGVSRIFISGGDAGGAPTVELHLYGMDSQGNSADLSGQSFVVQHNGAPVTDVVVAPEPYPGGTFTVFLMDLTSGVSPSIPAIQEGLRQYAAEPNMVEQLDYVAIFKVGELAAEQVMAPDTFHNSVINAFATPPQPVSGNTALRDSAIGLLDNMATLKPRPDMVAHLVILSDGTDAISSQSQPEDLPKRGADLGIPIHTIWLGNDRIDSSRQQQGQQYMSQVAAGSLGTAWSLTTAEDIAPLWSHLASFRNQTIVRYTAQDLTGGDFSVSLSLANSPGIQAQTTLSVPPGAPSITINVSEGSRDLSMPVEGQPIQLSFSTSVSWLDGVEREVTAAQLLVNAVAVQDIDPGTLSQFDTAISTFVFGDNRVQVAIVDDQGGRATSPAVVLNVTQGDLVVPEDVAPRSAVEQLWDRFSGIAVWVGGCFVALFVVFFLMFITWLARKSPLMARLGIPRMLRNLPFVGQYYAEAYHLQDAYYKANYAKDQVGRYSDKVGGTRRGKGKAGPAIGFLEVIEASTQFSGRIEIDQLDMKLGRSAKQADIVFASDRTVSRIHASIVKEGNDFRLFDEQSASGSWVNEQRVPDYGIQLMDGDEIRLGAVRLRFRQP